MEEKTINRNEALAALAEHYRRHYDRWEVLMLEAKRSLSGDDDREAFKAIMRLGQRKSAYMDGIKDAAELVGISPEEFMVAVNADRDKGD